MLRPLFGLASTALLLLALPHCSDGGGSEGASCASVYDSVVAYYDRCQGGAIAGQLSNQKGRYQLLCSKQLAAPGAGGSYNSAVQACANKLSTQACGDDVECDDEGYKGTLADGAGCAEGYQCASGYCAKTPSDSSSGQQSCGKCAPKIPIGGACKGTSRECADDGECKFTGSGGGTCQARKIAKAGEECFSNGGTVECEPGTTCFFPRGAVPSTAKSVCRAPAGVDGDCGTTRDCATGLACLKDKCGQPPGLGQACDPGTAPCAKGLACGSDQKCQTVVFVAAGGDCDSLVRVCTRGRCKGSGFEASSGGAITIKPGKCEDPLPDGAPCTTDRPTDSGDGPQPCDVFARCLNGVCTIPDPANCK